MNDELFAIQFYDLTLKYNSIGKALCKLLDVPYYEDRGIEQLLGHRYMRKDILEGNSRIYGSSTDDRLEGPLLSMREFLLVNGDILRTNDWKLIPSDAKQLTEEVWTRDDYPDSYNNIVEAVNKLSYGITGAYYHKSQANLVLLSPTGEKVGIRKTQFMMPTRSMLAERIAPFSRLRKAATA